MPRQDPDSLVRQNRVRRLCRELSQLLQTSVQQRQTIDELLARMLDVTQRERPPLVRAAGRATDVSQG